MKFRKKPVVIEAMLWDENPSERFKIFRESADIIDVVESENHILPGMWVRKSQIEAAKVKRPYR